MPITGDEHEKFPSNSYSVRQNEPSDNDEEVVVTGKKVIREKSFKDKVADFFFESSAEAAADYVMHDIVKPAFSNIIADIVDGIFDMVRDSIDTALHRSYRGRRYRDNVYYDMPSYNAGRERESRRERRRDRDEERSSRRDRKRYSNRSDDVAIVCDSSSDARRLKDKILDRYNSKGYITVAQVYTMADVNTTPPDFDYGWDEDYGIEVGITPISGGDWLVEVNDPIYLDER